MLKIITGSWTRGVIFQLVQHKTETIYLRRIPNISDTTWDARNNRKFWKDEDHFQGIYCRYKVAY